MVEGQGIGEASAAVAVPKPAPTETVSSSIASVPSFSERSSISTSAGPDELSGAKPASAAKAAESVTAALEQSSSKSKGLDVESKAIDAPTVQEAISAAEQAVNAALKDTLGVNEQIRIGVDASAEAFVYQTVDKESGEVKNQFPSEEALRRLAFWRSRETGIPPSTSGVVVDGKV